MNTYLEFVKTNHHIKTNFNSIKNKIEKIRKNENIKNNSTDVFQQSTQFTT